MEQPCFKETPLKIGMFLVFSLILSFDLCTAQRQVKLQEGPLVRAEGRHITIQCDVSGYQQSPEQNFEWSISRPDKPDLKIQIISTKDPNFSYAIYGKRVMNKEIYIERIKGDSVLLHITNLQKSDEGVYECFTPNTDSVYWGSYSAVMNLTVISDTLSATSVPQTLNKVEGDSLELVCEVSKQTSQHTHVAVTWYLQKGDQNLTVISLTRDFVLYSGEAYKQRQASGDVRLDKIGATSFKLTIYKLQTSDQGEFYCEGTEWIQDLDKSWQVMTNKRTEKTTVNVKSIGKKFLALIKATAVNITVGGSLEITCTVEAQNFPDRFFSVAWFLDNNEIIRIGPNAVPSFHGEYEMRETLGKVTVSKKNDRDYVLKMYQIQVEDGGAYHCQVEESEKISSGAFSTKKSNEVTITVQRPQANRNVVISSNTTEVLESDYLQFACGIHSVTAGYGQLSITWQFINKQDLSYDIIGMNQDGTQVTYQPYHERVVNSDVRMARVRSDSFTLVIYNALTSDEGQYACQVMEWAAESNGNWQLIGDYVSGNMTVTIKSLESSFAVTAITRTPSVRYYGTFELQCFIRPSHLTYVSVSVSWKFQPANSNDSYHLVNFTHDTAIVWGDKVENFKGKAIVVKTVSNTLRLSVSRASKLEAGKFLCIAELWGRHHPNQWVKKASATSNILEVKVRPPASLLQLTKPVRTIQKRTNDITELECRILAQTQNDSEFSVTWLFSKIQEPNVKGENLLNIGRNNIVQYYGELLTDTQKKMKFRDEKTSNGVYKLIIQKTGVDDSGSYYCHVTEWLLDPNSIWYKVGENTSATTTVQVHRAVATLHSKACASPSLFYFIFIYPFIIFIVLIIFALYFHRRPKKKQKSANEKSLWTPIEPIVGDPKGE
ncbi:immunoglobulin superfamily member 3-like [Heptranchias perlo]|uniref:immunoglobulin superfamily member 3-like n=1 Tax=Heptranchias perlo TaxID=212740 RepID=UPI0035598CEA